MEGEKSTTGPYIRGQIYRYRISIYNGLSFEDYLETEFLGKKHSAEPLSERIKDTGIWYYLIGK